MTNTAHSHRLLKGIIICTAIEAGLVILAVFHFLGPHVSGSVVAAGPDTPQEVTTYLDILPNAIRYDLYPTSLDAQSSVDPFLHHPPVIITSPLSIPIATPSPSVTPYATAYCNCNAQDSSLATPDAYGLVVPIRYQYISQTVSGSHNGIDFVANNDTPVYAAKAGTVTTASDTGYNGGWGHYIVIDHGNGLISIYAHLDTVATRAGETVTQGQPIGASGSTGRSTGPHLHFECRLNDHIITPFQLS